MTAVMETDQLEQQRSELKAARIDIYGRIKRLQDEIDRVAANQLAADTAKDVKQLKVIMRRFGGDTKDLKVKLKTAGWIIKGTLAGSVQVLDLDFEIRANAELCGHMRDMETMKGQQATLDRQIIDIQRQLQLRARGDD